MNVGAVNNISFNARIQFNNKRSQKTVNRFYSLYRNAKAGTALCLKRSFTLIACFPAILSRVLKVKNSIKLPS